MTIILIAITITTLIYYADTLPSKKCCAFNEHLIEDNSTVSCVAETPRTLQIHAISSTNSTHDCIDVIQREGEDDFVAYVNGTIDAIEIYASTPKCCPIGFVYDANQHRCVESNATLTFPNELRVLKVGMGFCTYPYVIVDYANAKNVTIDANGTAFVDGKTHAWGAYCIDANVVRACEAYETVCARQRCLRKCCPDGASYMKKKTFKCVATFATGINIDAIDGVTKKHDKDFAVLHMKSSGKRRYFDIDDEYTIDGRGNFLYDLRRFQPHDASYCIDTIVGANNTHRQVVLRERFDAFSVKRYRFLITGASLIVSCVFLLLTLIAYCYLSQRRTLYGRSIMIYCSVMLACMLALATAKFFGPQFSYNLCVTLGFLIQFLFLCAFSWLNIICFDMWLAFGTMRVINTSNKQIAMKKFLFYNLYGWGVPLFIVLITYGVFATRIFAEPYLPHIGEDRCFFDGDREGTYDLYIYFVLPLATLILINCVLFLKTILYCFEVKSEIRKMNDGDKGDKAQRKQLLKADKEKLIILVKLFLVMGVLWSFEILSSIISFRRNIIAVIVEAVLDVANCLQGVYIFIIFICKKPTLRKIGKRLAKTFCKKFVPAMTDQVTSTRSTSLRQSTHNKCDNNEA